jgi:small conductance mechanosensitive channel
MLILLQGSSTQRVLDNAAQIKDVVWQSLNNLVTGIVEQLPYLIAGLLVMLLFWALSAVIRRIFMSATTHTRLDERLRILFGRLIVGMVFVLGIFTTLTVVVPSFAFGDFIAGLGLTSLAIGFAVKDILNHLISGILILWQQPFRIGDFISVKENEGWVHYIGVRATSLRKSNGEIILIPNGDIYSSPLKVRRAGTSYPMSLKFSVGYDADIEKTKSLVKSTLLESGSVVNDPAPRVAITELSSEGIRVTANFRINSNENRPLVVFDEVASRVLETLAGAGIEIFPPSSVYMEKPAGGVSASEGQYSN